MRNTLFCLGVFAAFICGCNHDFPKAASHDADPEEDAVAEAAPPALDAWAPRDLTMPSTCPTAKPDGGLVTDCAKIDTWVCLGQCGDYSRLACFSGQVLQRELRCNSGGDCACVAKPGATPAPCLGLPIPSRTGCDRAKAAYIYGCCN